MEKRGRDGKRRAVDAPPRSELAACCHLRTLRLEGAQLQPLTPRCRAKRLHLLIGIVPTFQLRVVREPRQPAASRAVFMSKNNTRCAAAVTTMSQQSAQRAAERCVRVVAVGAVARDHPAKGAERSDILDAAAPS